MTSPPPLRFPNFRLSECSKRTRSVMVKAMRSMAALLVLSWRQIFFAVDLDVAGRTGVPSPARILGL